VALDFHATLDVLRRQFLNQIAHRAMRPRMVLGIVGSVCEDLADLLVRDVNAISVRRESAHLSNPAVKRVAIESIPAMTRHHSERAENPIPDLGPDPLFFGGLCRVPGFRPKDIAENGDKEFRTLGEHSVKGERALSISKEREQRVLSLRDVDLRNIAPSSEFSKSFPDRMDQHTAGWPFHSRDLSREGIKNSEDLIHGYSSDFTFHRL
jgi:hypothetical protein